MRLYLIRHGETDWNTQKRLQGSADIPLNRNGRELARLTAEGLRDVQFDLIYTSPLIRAKETAEILREERDIPILVDDRLKEIYFGGYEGHSCDRSENSEIEPGVLAFFTDPANYVPIDGGESIAELCERTTEFLNEIIANPNYKDMTILISGHGTVVKGLMSSLTITDLKDFWQGGFHKNCGVTIIDVQNGEAHVVQENVIYYDPAKAVDLF